MGFTQLFEFAERIFKIWVGTAWGKGALALILGGVLSITSVVQYVIPPIARMFGINITIPDTPAWLSLTLIVLGILRLVLQRLLPDRSEQPRKPPEPNPHDVKLLTDYQALMTPELIGFLIDHSFRNAYRVDTLNPLETIAYGWRGAHYEFLDADLQHALSDVIGAARGLCNMIANHIFLDYRNQAIGSPLTDVDRQIGITRDAIERMNILAKGVVTTANNFEKLARQNIPS